MAGSKTSIHSLRFVGMSIHSLRYVGMGSRMHDFDAEDLISLEMSSSVAG